MENKKSIGVFFKKEYFNLKRYVTGLIGNSSDIDSEDVIQDVMFNIFNKSDFTVPLNNVAGYIYRSLKNKVIDLFRKKNSRTLSLDSGKDDEDFSLYEVLYDIRYDIFDELYKKELFKIIDSLDDEYRLIVIATEFEGKKFRDLSAEWNVPIGTLLTRKMRAINKIKEEILKLN